MGRILGVLLRCASKSVEAAGDVSWHVNINVACFIIPVHGEITVVASVPFGGVLVVLA